MTEILLCCRSSSLFRMQLSHTHRSGAEGRAWRRSRVGRPFLLPADSPSPGSSVHFGVELDSWIFIHWNSTKGASVLHSFKHIIKIILICLFRSPAWHRVFSQRLQRLRAAWERTAERQTENWWVMWATCLQSSFHLPIVKSKMWCCF